MKETKFLALFYDQQLVNYDLFCKQVKIQNQEIVETKEAMGITMPQNPVEASLLSLTRPIPESYVKSIIKRTLDLTEIKETRSLSNCKLEDIKSNMECDILVPMREVYKKTIPDEDETETLADTDASAKSSF